jgi:ribonuclease D
MEHSPPRALVVDDPGGLEVCLGALAGAAEVAFDTEADSLHHYYEKVCLLQVGTPSCIYLVDPLAGLDLRPLFARLAETRLILHGGDYDLRLLSRDHAFAPRQVFDTMLAAQFLGYEALGLGALVERHFGASLDKAMQKADWSKRPMAPRLLEYAAQDVRFLLPLAERLRAELEARGRAAWHAAACARLARTRHEAREADPERAWRITGSGPLSPQAQAFLRELWRFREDEAQASDLPSFKIIGNETLLTLAARAAESPNGEVPEEVALPRTFKGGRLARLLAALDRARHLPEAAWPRPLRGESRRRDVRMERRLHQLKLVRDAVASELAIDPSLLAPKAALVAIAAADPKSLEELEALEALMDWQTELLGRRLLTAAGGA